MAAKKILIIDDDPIFCFILQKQLPKDIVPFAKIFNKAKEAISYIVQENVKDTEFLIFLDLNMPVMSGWEFLDVVKKNEYVCAIKIVIVTSSINPEDERQASAYSQVIDFLEKPIAEQELFKILETSWNYTIPLKPSR
jgi:CheY-like chemotaxis protein